MVYASNHSSMFDIWALAAALPGSIRFVAKQELARIPLLGQAMRRRRPRHDRPHQPRAGDGGVRRRRRERIREQGVSTVVFPEGTRSRTGELLPFKNAPFGLAIAAQVPLVPLYVHAHVPHPPQGRLAAAADADPRAGGRSDPDRRPDAAHDREALRERARAAIAALARAR